MTGRLSLESIDTDWAGAEPAWPGYELSAIGTTTSGQVVTVDRGGRTWNDRTTTTGIAVPTVRWWRSNDTIERAVGQDLFGLPHGLEVVEDGVWVTDVGWHQVVHLTNAGEPTLVLGTPGVAGSDEACLGMPTDIVRTDDGCLYVTDGYMNSRVVRFTPDGSYDGEWGIRGTEPGEFQLPHAIVVDNDQTLLVADRENNRIQRFTTEGQLLDVIDDPAIGKPYAVALTGDYLLVADCGFPQTRTASLVTINRHDRSVDRHFELGAPSGLVAPHHLRVIGDVAYVVDVIQGIRRFQLT